MTTNVVLPTDKLLIHSILTFEHDIVHDLHIGMLGLPRAIATLSRYSNLEKSIDNIQYGGNIFTIGTSIQDKSNNKNRNIKKKHLDKGTENRYKRASQIQKNKRDTKINQSRLLGVESYSDSLYSLFNKYNLIDSNYTPFKLFEIIKKLINSKEYTFYKDTFLKDNYDIITTYFIVCNLINELNPPLRYSCLFFNGATRRRELQPRYNLNNLFIIWHNTLTYNKVGKIFISTFEENEQNHTQSIIEITKLNWEGENTIIISNPFTIIKNQYDWCRIVKNNDSITMTIFNNITKDNLVLSFISKTLPQIDKIFIDQLITKQGILSNYIIESENTIIDTMKGGAVSPIEQFQRLIMKWSNCYKKKITRDGISIDVGYFLMKILKIHHKYWAIPENIIGQLNSDNTAGNISSIYGYGFNASPIKIQKLLKSLFGTNIRIQGLYRYADNVNPIDKDIYSNKYGKVTGINYIQYNNIPIINKIIESNNSTTTLVRELCNDNNYYLMENPNTSSPNENINNKSDFPEFYEELKNIVKELTQNINFYRGTNDISVKVYYFHIINMYIQKLKDLYLGNLNGEKYRKHNYMFTLESSNFNGEEEFHRLMNIFQLLTEICNLTNQVESEYYFNFIIIFQNKFLFPFQNYIDIFKTGCSMGSKTLTKNQKVNMTYFIALACSSHKYGVKQYLNDNNSLSNLQNSFFKLESDLIDSIINSKNIKRSKTGVGDIDSKALNGIINYLKNESGNWEGNSKFVSGKASDSNTFTDQLKDNWFNKIDPGKKYYLNNSINAGKKLGNILGNHFCNLGSIMDAMSICNTIEGANLNEGLEYGVTDIMLTNKKNGAENISYRIRVELDSATSPKFAFIHAYYKVGNNVLIQVGNGGNGSTWPNSPQHNEPHITVPLNNQQGSVDPLSAVETNKELSLQCIQIYNTEFSSNNNVTITDILKNINTSTNSQYNTYRKQILNKSFRKSLGDFLQELYGVVHNSGYVEPVVRNPNILEPNKGRLILSNDRPSAIRLFILILFATEGINPKCMGGYINKQGKYNVAYRLPLLHGGNIARNNIKNKQTRNRNMKNKKTRNKNKYNKLTRKKIKNMKNKKLNKKKQTRNKKKTTRKR